MSERVRVAGVVAVAEEVCGVELGLVAASDNRADLWRRLSISLQERNQLGLAWRKDDQPLGSFTNFTA